MGASDFEDVVEFAGFVIESLMESGQQRKKRVFDGVEGGQMDGGGNGVIAGLAAIDVVIGMDELAAAMAAEQFHGAIGDDLVGIHVGRSAGAGLENIQDKFAVPFAVDDLLGGLNDGGGQFGFEGAQFLVGEG